jgi:hypothetical protein
MVEGSRFEDVLVPAVRRDVREKTRNVGVGRAFLPAA